MSNHPFLECIIEEGSDDEKHAVDRARGGRWGDIAADDTEPAAEESPAPSLRQPSSELSPASPRPGEFPEAFAERILLTIESVHRNCSQETSRLAQRTNHVERMLQQQSREVWQLSDFVRSQLTLGCPPGAQDGPASARDHRGSGPSSVEGDAREDAGVNLDELALDDFGEGEIAQRVAEIQAQLALDLRECCNQSIEEVVGQINHMAGETLQKVSDLAREFADAVGSDVPTPHLAKPEGSAPAPGERRAASCLPSCDLAGPTRGSHRATPALAQSCGAADHPADPTSPSEVASVFARALTGELEEYAPLEASDLDVPSDFAGFGSALPLVAGHVLDTRTAAGAGDQCYVDFESSSTTLTSPEHAESVDVADEGIQDRAWYSNMPVGASCRQLHENVQCAVRAPSRVEI